MALTRLNKIRYVVVETSDHLLSFFRIEPGFGAGVLFERVQFADIDVATRCDDFGCFAENIIQVFNVLQYQAETDQVVQPVSESPGLRNICLPELHLIGGYLASGNSQHALR